MQSESSQQNQSLHLKKISGIFQGDQSTNKNLSTEVSILRSYKTQLQSQATPLSKYQPNPKQKKQTKPQVTLSSLNEIMISKQQIKNQKIDVSPEVAAVVVEKYLLPMFEMDNRFVLGEKRGQQQGKSENTKSKTEYSQSLQELENAKQTDRTDSEKIQKTFNGKNFQLPQRNLQPYDKTVYAELKLSERLYKELQIARQQLDETTQKLKESIQNTAELQVNLDNQKLYALEANIAATMVKQQHENQLKQCNIQQFDKEYYIQQNEVSKQMYEQIDKQREDFGESLRNQLAKADKLENKITEYEHENAILRMENDIMGERLRTLYMNQQLIANNKNQQEQLIQENRNFHMIIQYFLRVFNIQKTQINETISQRDELLEESKLQQQGIQELIKDRDKIKNLTNHKISELTKENIIINNQNMAFETTNNELKQKNKSLGDELDKVRVKMHSLSQRFKRFGDQEIKTCRNCQKEYSENQNLNWSCRTHKSPWQGEIYWCCGKTNEKAPGCKTSKHESKEDGEEDQRENEENEKTALKNVYCPNCKELGHSYKDCERDPNFRTEKSIKQEFKRIEEIFKKRKQNKGHNTARSRYQAIQALQQQINKQMEREQQIPFTFPFKLEEG